MTNISNFLINKKVVHKTYGVGTIESLKFDGSNDLKLFVTFTDDNNELIKKVFIAKLAFSSGIIKFLDNQDYILLNNFFNEFNKLSDKYISKFISELLATNIIKQKELDIENGHILMCVDKIINKKNISLDLISVFNDLKFEKDLYEHGFGVLSNIIKGTVNNDKAKNALIILLLTYISLKHYDGNFFSHLEELFNKHAPNNAQSFSKNKIYNTICEILVHYKEEVKYFDQKSYIAVPVVLCCVPHNRMDDLFRFAFDIYKKKMLYDEDLTDDQIYFKVLETLSSLRKKDLVGNTDTIKIKGSEYLMSKYTQSCIYSGKCIEDLTGIISHCIKLIIYHFTRHEDSFVVDDYYKNGFKAFIDYFENNKKEKERRDSKRSFSRPYFKYEKNNKIYLVTGELGFEDMYDPTKIELVTFCDGKKDLEMKLNSLGDVDINDDDDIGGYKLKRRKILLDCNVLNKFSYSIMCDGKELYNSKKRLYRTNIFFNEYGEEVTPGTDYNGLIRVITQNSNKEIYGSEIEEIKVNCSIFSTVVDVNNQDIFLFDDQPYIFYKISEPKIIGYAIPWAEFISFERKEYNIYKKMSIIFQAPCETEDIIININNINNDNCEMDENINYNINLISRESNGLNAFEIKFFKLFNGLNEIKIINRITSQPINKCHFKFLLDSKLDKEFIREDKNGKIFELRSSMIKKNAEFYYKKGCSLLEFDSFAKGLGYGKLNIYPSSVNYSIDNVEWCDLFDDIFIPSINDKQNYVYICGPSNLIAYYFDNDKKTKNPVVLIQDEEDKMRYKLDIDYFRKRNFNRTNTLKIYFEFAKWKKYLTLQFVPEVNKKDSKFYYNENEKTHYFRIFFKGAPYIKCKIYKTNSENIFFDDVINSGQIIKISQNDLEENIKYLTVSLHRKVYGSLMSSYNNDAFYTFPKYPTNPFDVKLIENPSLKYDSSDNYLWSSVKYKGTSFIKATICPSGFKKVVFEKNISSNEIIKFVVKDQIFDSFNLLLYKQESSGVYKEIPFYISKPIKTDSKFLNKRLHIDKFILEKEEQEINCFFVSKRIVELERDFLINGDIYNANNNKIYIEDVCIKIKSFNGFKSKAGLYKIKNGKKTSLKLSGKGIIKDILLSV